MILAATCHLRATDQQNVFLSIDRHKKRTPGSPCTQGLCRLLAQIVGSFDPGGVGVSGDGVPPGSGLSIFKS
jgi:hypothetical protein